MIGFAISTLLAIFLLSILYVEISVGVFLFFMIKHEDERIKCLSNDGFVAGLKQDWDFFKAAFVWPRHTRNWYINRK